MQDGTVLDTRTYNIDLNAGTTIDWDVSLLVSSPGPTSLVPPGWYVVPDNTAADGSGSAKSHQHVMLAGEEVNGLDGWDLDRLGWFKMAAGGQAVLPLLRGGDADRAVLRHQRGDIDNGHRGDFDRRPRVGVRVGSDEPGR